MLTKSWKQVLLGGIATMSTGTAFNPTVAFGLTWRHPDAGLLRNQTPSIALDRLRAVRECCCRCSACCRTRSAASR
ncbi:hypothetical protein ACU4GD_00185 [Cupriavidus basilensis]